MIPALPNVTVGEAERDRDARLWQSQKLYNISQDENNRLDKFFKDYF